MNFDFQTILFFIGINNFLIIVILGFYVLITHNKSWYILSFTLGKILIFAGLAMLALRGRIPDIVSIQIANTLIVAGVILETISTVSFQGKLRKKALIFMLVWGVLFHLLFLITAQSSYLRSIFDSMGLSLIILSGVVDLFENRKKYRLPLLLGMFYGVYSLATFLRIIPIWQLKEEYSFLDFNAFDLFYLFVILAITMIGPFGFILMLKEVDDKTIEESNQLRKTAFGQSPLGIAIADINGIIRYVNKAFEQQSLVKAEDIVDKPAQIIISQLKPQERKAELLASLGRNEVWQGEFIREIPGQESMVFESVITPVFNDKNEVYSYVSFTSDVSFKKYHEKLIQKQNDELKQINQSKDWLFSVLAHDLRSPIGNISSMLKLVSQFMQTNNTEKAQKYLHLAADTSGKTYELLDNLLKWAINQQSLQTGQAEMVNLKDIIDPTLDLYQNLIRQKKIELLTSYPPVCNVFADNDMIQTAFRNILSNAIKFTPPHGKISIICKEEGSKVYMQIRDSGVGMTQSQINNLFVFKEKKSTKGTQGESGTGIGMVLAQQFIKLNKGHIKVESMPGKGSIFTISLPSKEIEESISA